MHVNNNEVKQTKLSIFSFLMLSEYNISFYLYSWLIHGNLYDIVMCCTFNK